MLALVIPSYPLLTLVSLSKLQLTQIAQVSLSWGELWASLGRACGSSWDGYLSGGHGERQMLTFC